TIVIWGNYTADTINANIQLGTLTAFKYNHFDRDVLERTANVRVQLTDETTQSLALNVLAVMGVMYNADGDLYSMARTGIALDALKTLTPATLTGTGVSFHVQRFYLAYRDNPAVAVNEMSEAINIDAGNALLYGFYNEAFYRQVTANQTGQFRYLTGGQRLLMTTNAESAKKLGPEDWALASLLFYSGVGQDVMAKVNQAIELRPDDWYLYYARSDMNVLSASDPEGIKQATADLETAVLLHPDLQIPQALIIFNKLNDGQIADTIPYLDDFITRIPPDTFFTARLLEESWSSGYLQVSRIYAPFSKLILGQYQAALDILNEAARSGVGYVPGASIFMTSIAQCSLHNDDAALVAMDYDTTTVMYLFKAEIALKQGKRDQAMKYLANIQRSDQGNTLAPFVAGVLNGEFGCKDLFNSAKIRQIVDKYGNLKAADLAVTLTAVAPIPTIVPTATAPAVTPVAQGEYMVLVAPFEAVKTETRDVARLIVDDLKQELEVEAPYSKLRVRTYTTVITSDDDAQIAAQATGATVVIWGNYTADAITANIQLGDLSAFKYNRFDRTVLERTANVKTRMTDETTQSLAPDIVAMIGVIYNADGDLYGIARTWVVMEALQSLTPAELVGDSVAVQVHRFYLDYTGNPSQAVDEINQTINADAGNALLYAFHSEAFYHESTLNQQANAITLTKEQASRLRTDAESAQKLGPKEWALAPLLVYTQNTSEGVAIFTDAINLRPNDWYLYFMRSAFQVQS
ncbi:MAG TPA: hypothetical protein VHL11_00335, partial [Phototrophicaceae bacterium]|nr:hypothetical protein [Phototrophicaceae bacterium]